MKKFIFLISLLCIISMPVYADQYDVNGHLSAIIRDKCKKILKEAKNNTSITSDNPINCVKSIEATENQCTVLFDDCDGTLTEDHFRRDTLTIMRYLEGYSEYGLFHTTCSGMTCKIEYKAHPSRGIDENIQAHWVGNSYAIQLIPIARDLFEYAVSEDTVIRSDSVKGFLFCLKHQKTVSQTCHIETPCNAIITADGRNRTVQISFNNKECSFFSSYYEKFQKTEPQDIIDNLMYDFRGGFNVLEKSDKICCYDNTCTFRKKSEDCTN